MKSQNQVKAGPGTAAARVLERVANGVQQWHSGKVSVWLSARDAQTVRLEALWSEVRRRAGAGNAALAMINRIADEEQVAVELVPHRLLYEIDAVGITQTQADLMHGLNCVAPDNAGLQAWYERNGYIATGRLDGDDPVMRREPDAENAPEGISRGVAERLNRELKSWADGMVAFRYESFARRIIAAEYGRSDAVEWANGWYMELITAEEAARERVLVAAADEAARTERARAKLHAGRCSNPNYQAFLDTVEDCSTIETNAPYFAWISPLIGEFERRFPQRTFTCAADRTNRWSEFLTQARNEQLSERVRREQAQLSVKN